MNSDVREQRSRDPRGMRSNSRRTDATAKNGDAKEAPRPRGAALRKLTPKAKPPLASVMRRMNDEDAATLRRILSEPMECVYHKSFPCLLYTSDAADE